MTKRQKPHAAVMLNLFQHLACFFLLSGDTPFIPVHRTGFSGVTLINSKLQFQMTKTVLVKNLVFRYWDLFVIWPACAKPLRRRQVLRIWCFNFLTFPLNTQHLLPRLFFVSHLLFPRSRPHLNPHRRLRQPRSPRKR